MFIWTRRTNDKIKMLDAGPYRRRDRLIWGALSLQESLGFTDEFVTTSNLESLEDDNFSYDMGDVLLFDNEVMQYYLDIEIWHQSKYRDWEVLRAQNDYTDAAMIVEENLVGTVLTLRTPPVRKSAAMLEDQLEFEEDYAPEVISSIELKETLTVDKLTRVSVYHREQTDIVNTEALEHFETTRRYLFEIEDAEHEARKTAIDKEEPRAKDLLSKQQELGVDLREQEWKYDNLYTEYRFAEVKWFERDKQKDIFDIDEVLRGFADEVRVAQLTSMKSVYIVQEQIEDFIDEGKIGVAEILQWTASNVNVESETHSTVTSYRE